MKWTILKWIVPVVSYILFVCFFYFMDVVENLVYGFTPNTGPTVLLDYFIIFLLLPLILWGYILLLITQYLYKKKEKWAKIFAWTITLLCMVLFTVNEWNYIGDWFYFLFIVLSDIVFYYFVFFVSLFYVLRKEKNLKK